MREVQVIIERRVGPTGPFFKPTMPLIHRFVLRGGADPGRHIVPQSRLVPFGDKDIMGLLVVDQAVGRLLALYEGRRQ